MLPRNLNLVPGNYSNKGASQLAKLMDKKRSVGDQAPLISDSHLFSPTPTTSPTRTQEGVSVLAVLLKRDKEYRKK
jgi:hypothetical protein